MTTRPTDAFDALVIESTEAALKPSQDAIEATILSGLFTSPEAASHILEDTRPGDFHFAANRAFAAVVWPALADGRHVDRVTFDADLKRIDDRDWRSLGLKPADRDAVLKVADRVFAGDTDRPALGKVEAYLTIFTEDAKKRHAKDLIDKVGDQLGREDLSATEAASEAFKIVTDLDSSRRLVGSYKSEADAWPAYFAALQANQTQKNFIGLDTGFDHLNNVANGLVEGLFILGAKPSLGKTTFAKQLIDQVIELNSKAAGLFVSLEQSREELRVKTLSRLSGVENRDILRGRLDSQSEAWRRVTDAGEEYLTKVAGRLFILEGDKTTTPDRIRLAVNQVKRATEAEVVFVVIDYLQIVPTAEEFKDVKNRVDAVVSDLRRMARDLHAPVMAIASINRGAYKKSEGTLEAYKESGGIEFGADLAGVLVGDKDLRGTDPIEGVNRSYKGIHLDLIKNRNGERSRITFKFYPSVSLFVEGDKTTLPEETSDD